MGSPSNVGSKGRLNALFNSVYESAQRSASVCFGGLQDARQVFRGSRGLKVILRRFEVGFLIPYTLLGGAPHPPDPLD